MPKSKALYYEFEEHYHYLLPINSLHRKMGKNSFPKTVQFNLTTTCSHALPQIKEQVEHAVAMLETGKKLDQINFRKDFWDCYRG